MERKSCGDPALDAELLNAQRATIAAEAAFRAEVRRQRNGEEASERLLVLHRRATLAVREEEVVLHRWSKPRAEKMIAEWRTEQGAAAAHAGADTGRLSVEGKR